MIQLFISIILKNVANKKPYTITLCLSEFSIFHNNNT